MDPDVHILRFVNKLRPDYPADAGGFRSVLLNLRLNLPATRQLGLEWHVCELQLILIDFERIKVRAVRV
jgi:hypothetical protein